MMPASAAGPDSERKAARTGYSGLVTDAAVTRRGSPPERAFALSSGRFQAVDDDDRTAGTAGRGGGEGESGGGGGGTASPSSATGGGMGGSSSHTPSAERSVPNCCADCGGWSFQSAVEAAVLWLALPCVLYYYHFMYVLSHAEAEEPVQSRKVMAVAVALVLLLVAQLVFSVASRGVFDEEDWEESARQFGNVMLASGVVFGFLFGLVVVRYVLLPRWCMNCKRGT